MKNFSALFLLFLLWSSCKPKQEENSNTLKTSEKIEANQEVQTSKNGSLTFLASIDNAYYYIDEPRYHVYLYTELKADFFKKEAQRTPLNLSIVIDRSGSMEGEKLDYAKDAAIQAVNLLSAVDYVSIISYEDGVQVVHAASAATNKEEIIAKIKRINSGGSTFLSGGMIKGFEAVKENYKADYINRVFLLSDGLANEGITDEIELAKIAASWKKNENISLSTFGIGTGFNEDLMTELAEQGRGNYYFINEAKEIPAIFEKEMNGLLSLVAKNVVLEVNYPGAALQLERVYGYTYDASPNTVSINLGEMYSEETKAVLFKFSLDAFYKDDLVFTSLVDFEDLSKEKVEK
ncbi:MAG: VWA domain-containing protein, partial [Bacteroidetes bacterium]|nr:VWA domain-containing protein [Bacteroidota bacterium]